MTIKQLRKELDKMSKKDLKILYLGADEIISNLEKEKNVYKRTCDILFLSNEKLNSAIDKQNKKIAILDEIAKTLQVQISIKNVLYAKDCISKETKC